MSVCGPNFYFFGRKRLMPSSHRRHRQVFLYCLVLSCRCLRCELNWRQVKTAGDWKFRNRFVRSRNAVWTEYCLVLTHFPIFATWLLVVTPYLETGSRLVHKCVHTADKTGQNCSVSNILKTVCDCRELSSHHRQDKTRRSCVVGVCGVN